MEHQAFRKGGEIVGLEILGTTMYTCVVLIVNLQMALSINYFTYIQHLFIWGSVLFWYLFLLGYGAMSPTISSTAFMVFIEACAPSPSFWLVTLFVSIATLFPFFTYSAVQRRFFPMCHQMIQLMSFSGNLEDPEYCQMVRRRSSTPTNVGYTARFKAKSKSFQEEPWGADFRLETFFPTVFGSWICRAIQRENTICFTNPFMYIFASTNPSQVRDTNTSLRQLQRQVCIWLCMLNARRDLDRSGKRGKMLGIRYVSNWVESCSCRVFEYGGRIRFFSNGN